jgi:hypothetical protein
MEGVYGGDGREGSALRAPRLPAARAPCSPPRRYGRRAREENALPIGRAPALSKGSSSLRVRCWTWRGGAPRKRGVRSSCASRTGLKPRGATGAPSTSGRYGGNIRCREERRKRAARPPSSPPRRYCGRAREENALPIGRASALTKGSSSLHVRCWTWRGGAPRERGVRSSYASRTGLKPGGATSAPSISERYGGSIRSREERRKRAARALHH